MAVECGGVVLLFMIAEPWPAYIYSQVPHAIDLWRYESIGEIGENFEKARPLYFYIPGFSNHSAVDLTHHHWRNSGMAPPTIPTAAIFSPRVAGCHGICFSLLHVKKNAYLLPVMPAAVLLSAQGMVAVVVSRRMKFSERDHEAVNLSRSHRCIAAVSSTLALAVVSLLTFFVANKENGRSPQPICREIIADPQVAVCAHSLPEEASFYMPLEFNQDQAATTAGSTTGPS